MCYCFPFVFFVCRLSLLLISCTAALMTLMSFPFFYFQLLVWNDLVSIVALSDGPRNNHTFFFPVPLAVNQRRDSNVYFP
jgi:hypothetical protein